MFHHACTRIYERPFFITSPKICACVNRKSHMCVFSPLVPSSGAIIVTKSTVYYSSCCRHKWNHVAQRTRPEAELSRRCPYLRLPWFLFTKSMSSRTATSSSAKEALDSAKTSLSSNIVHWFTFLVLYDVSQLLNTQLDKETLALCIAMIESGVNPEALAVCLTP